jgi:hypothetical protein
MATAKQTSALPTRKLTVGSAVATGVTLYMEPVVSEVWPQIAPALLAGPSATQAVAFAFGMGAALLIAYWVPDAPNVPTGDGA